MCVARELFQPKPTTGAPIVCPDRQMLAFELSQLRTVWRCRWRKRGLDGDPGLLGAAVEATVGSRNGKLGILHKNGHVLIASIMGGEKNGVMADTDAARRDPMFYRWHKRIADIFLRWEDTQSPESFDQWAPPVKIRKGDGPSFDSPDIIFYPAKKLSEGLEDASARSLLAHTFGGDAWDSDFGGDTALSAGALVTHMLKRNLLFLETTPIRRRPADVDRARQVQASPRGARENGCCAFRRRLVRDFESRRQSHPGLSATAAAVIKPTTPTFTSPAAGHTTCCSHAGQRTPWTFGSSLSRQTGSKTRSPSHTARR
jgi:hypothetical protein